MRSTPFFICLFPLITFYFAGFSQQPPKTVVRPAYHFTPEKNWTNDPNGLVFFHGEYHLFFQHNPFGNHWGHMSWGHAVSKDLVRWNELPVAISEENNVGIFSGSVVLDPLNTAGFRKEADKTPMVAIYTADIPNTNQSQHLAYSLDSGRTFSKFAFNPVLDLDKKDFRDPKVFWHEPSKKWIMSVMLPHEKKVRFYGSKSLKAWSLLSEFGPAGDTTGIWECPDLFRVPVADNPGRYKWVFLMSPSPYMQYFVGEFDGTRFVNETPPNKILRPDYGPDYYAAISYNHMPFAQDPVTIGWVNNWNYAGSIPAGVWRGAMSLPRRLQVKKIGGDWVLLQRPTEEIWSLKKQERSFSSDQEIKPSDASFALEWSWEITNGKSQELVLGKSDLVVRYDSDSGRITIDRGGAGGFNNEAYRRLSVYRAVLPEKPTGPVKFTLFFDETIAELFVGAGELVMTAQVFAETPPAVIRFSGSAKPFSVVLKDLGAYREN